MVNTEITLIIFFVAQYREALYSQQKQDGELTMFQIMNSLLPNSDWNWRKQGKPLDHTVQYSSVQLLSHVRLFVTPWIEAHQAFLSITNSRNSLKLTSMELVMPSSHLILYRPLLLLPPIPPSIRVFSNESTLRMRWPKYWSFSFSIILFKEHPGLISFRVDWLDFLAVQGTLKSLRSPVCWTSPCLLLSFSVIS